MASEQLHYYTNLRTLRKFNDSSIMACKYEENDVYTVSYNAECPTVLRFSKVKPKKYCISPIDTNGSDIDDSDADPDIIQNSADDENSSFDYGDNHTSIEIEDVPKKGRKRKFKPENWQERNLKFLRNSGKTYISKSKKQISERKMRPPCGAKCRLACSININDAVRQKIFSNYWYLADLQKQREFIVRHTEQVKPKYRYSSTQNLRNLNSRFYLDVNETRIQVCKSFFKATLDINDRPIRTAISKKNDIGFLQCEMRGKHGKQPIVDPEIKQSVRNFINGIPRIESHYLRAQTTREFIEYGKSITDLYRDYKEDREKEKLPFSNLAMFRSIFHNEFNISFYVPKKDQCDLCESFRNADEETKKSLIQSYNHHQEEKELSRKEKDNDKNNPNGAYVAVYDLQAVMSLPKGLISSFYYKSKMSCFNFTVSDLNAKNVDCYFWNETDGKRGAVEIGSCVYHYITTLLQRVQKADLDIIFYSDNCCGQQKNKYLLSMYAYAVSNLNIRSITHKFLIRGHSQNEGDNVHSIIEKQIKRHLKSSPIYVPQQYITLIQMAKKNGPPYHIHELTHDDFYDLKSVQEEWGNNFTIDVDRVQVKWQDIKMLRVEKDYPFAFFYKTSYKDAVYGKVNVRNVRKSKVPKEKNHSSGLPRVYSKNMPLPDNKKKDIQDLINKNLIPKSCYESFFKSILD